MCLRAFSTYACLSLLLESHEDKGKSRRHAFLNIKAINQCHASIRDLVSIRVYSCLFVSIFDIVSIFCALFDGFRVYSCLFVSISLICPVRANFLFALNTGRNVLLV